VLALMLFGGETLRDFAFALLIGIASGTYSSIFIATPVLQHWKEREVGFRARHARILERLGTVPPYATVEQGGPIDVQPKSGGARRSISAPPGQEVSASEFQSMVRELGVEEEPASPARQPAATGAGGRPAGGRRARARAEGGTGTGNGAPSAGPSSSAPDNGENGDAKDRKPRNRRHGRPR
jgi:SecD/SecF fusion protein